MPISRMFIVYGLIGTFVTVMKLATLYLCRDVLGVGELASITVSYIIAVILHFFLNKHVTFRVRDKTIINFVTVKYLATLVIAYFIYTGNVFLFSRVFGIPFYPAVFLALGISYLVNYVVYRKIVFGVPDGGEAELSRLSGR